MLGIALWSSESKVKAAQSCPTLGNPMDYTVHGILQARILEWVAFPFSRGLSQPMNWTQVSCIAGGFFTSLAIREALMCTWMEIFIQNHNKFYWFRGFGLLRRRCKYDHNNSPFCQFLFDFSLCDPTIFFKGHFSHHV